MTREEFAKAYNTKRNKKTTANADLRTAFDNAYRNKALANRRALLSKNQTENEPQYKVKLPDVYKNDVDNLTKGAAGYKLYEDSIKKAVQAEEEKPWYIKVADVLAAGNTTDTSLPTAMMNQAITATRADESYRSPSQEWTDEERNAFGYLYAIDPKQAHDYAEETNNARNEHKKQLELDKAKREATKDGGSMFGNALAAIGAGLTGGADYLTDLVQLNARGKLTTEDGISPFEWSQAVKEGIGTKLNRDHGTIPEDVWVFGGKGWGDVYQLGSSIVESGIAAYTGGSIGTLAIFFGNAAAAGIDDAKARGATDDQAFLYGTLMGVAEGTAEKIGVDNLFRIGKSGKTGFINAAKEILKQAGAEGTEEGVTAVLGLVFDNMVMGDKSNYNALVSEYMAQGMSRGDAEAKASWQAFGDIVYDVVGGAVSGAARGTPQSVGTAIKQRRSDIATGRSIIELAGAKSELYDAANLSTSEDTKKLLERAVKAKKGSGKEARLTAQLARSVGAEYRDQTADYMTPEEIAAIEGDEAVARYEAEKTDFERKTEKYIEKQSKAYEKVAESNATVANIGLKSKPIAPSKKYNPETRDVYNYGRLEYNGDPREYDLYFEMARNLGLNADGRSFTDMFNTLSETDRKGMLTLDSDVIRAAFDDGVTTVQKIKQEQAAKDEIKKRAKEIEEAKAKKADEEHSNVEGNKTDENADVEENETEEVDKSNFLIDKSVNQDELNRTQRTAIERIRKLAEYLDGVSFRITNTLGEIDGNGYYDKENKTVVININAGKIGDPQGVFDFAVDAAWTHEIGHYIKEKSPQKFEEIKAFIKKEFYPNNTWDAAVEMRLDQYRAQLGKSADEFTFEMAEEEVVCNSLGKMLTSKRVMKRLAGEHRSAFGTIWRFVRDFFEKLIGKISGYGRLDKFSYRTAEEEIVLDGAKRKRDKLEKMFADALVDANTTAKAEQTVEYATKSKTAQNGENSGLTNTNEQNVSVSGENNSIKLSLSQNKISRLENYLFELGKLGIRLDAGGKSIRILTDKFTQNKNIFSNKGRNMREVNARIKAIPHFAEILRNCTYEGTDTDIHGLENDAKKGVVAMHRFKGAYDGFDIEVVVRDKGAKQFLYEMKFIEKEKSSQQSMTDESASPAPLGDAENELIITLYAQKSNTSGEKTSKKYSLSDREYMSAVERGDMDTVQAMVDEAAKAAGYTVEAYHGTNNDFTVFDKNKIVSGVTMFASQGSGFYFTANKSIAQKYAKGGKVFDAYLNADNWFSFINKTDSKVNRLLDEFARSNGESFNINDYSGYVDFEKRTGSVLSRIVQNRGKAFTEFLKRKGFDGIEYTAYNYDTDGYDKTYIVFDPEQIKSADPVVYDDSGNVIPLSERFNPAKKDIRYSLPETDSNGRSLTAEQREYFKDSRAVDSQGRLLVLYHQTGAEFTIFDTKREGAGARDNETPHGIFMKPTTEDIGLKGSKQMPLYANITKPLQFDTRAEALRYWERYIEGYADIIAEIAANDRVYREKIDEAFDLKRMSRMRRMEDSAARAALIEESKAASDRVFEEWEQANTVLDKKAKALIDAYLEKNGYDGVLLREDQGSFGRKVQTYIALHPEQVKNTNNATPTESPDIRYSLSDRELREKLAESFYGMAESDEERKAVEKYRSELNKVDEWMGERQQLIAEFEELRGVTGKSKERTEINKRIIVLNESITRHDEKLLKIAAAKPFRDVIDRYEAKAFEEGAAKSEGEVRMSAGQFKKMIADYTKPKVYSKSDAERAISSLEAANGVKGKKRAALVDEIWQGLNDAATDAERIQFVQKMSEKVYDAIITESRSENPEYQSYAERLDYLRQYTGRLTFSDDVMAEIKAKYDKQGSKSFLGRWQNKTNDGSSIGADVFVTDFARENPGYEYLEEMPVQDALFEINELYNDAVNADKTVGTFDEASAGELSALRSSIVDSILTAFDKGGEKSKAAKNYTLARADYFKNELENVIAINKEKINLDRIARKLRDKKYGTFQNATQIDTAPLSDLLRELSAFNYRGTISVNNVRDKVRALLSWYSTDNVMLEYRDPANPGYYNQEVHDILESLSSGKGDLSLIEYRQLYELLSYFDKFVDSYNKVWKNGKWIEAKEEAERFVGIIRENQKQRVGWVDHLIRNKFIELFGDPMAVARSMDYYQHGFYTTMMEYLRECTVKAQVAEMEMLSDYNAFLEKHPDYLKKAALETVRYDHFNIEEAKPERHFIPKLELISLYMTLKRQHAVLGFAFNGFKYDDLSGDAVRVSGIIADPETDYEIIEAQVDDVRNKIAKSLSKADMEYISILESVYNNDAKELKRRRDMERLGFSNVSDGYYYPIRRSDTATSVDSGEMQAELDRVSNASFNKDIVKGARHKLMIESADDLFRRHVRVICQYGYMQEAIEYYDKVYHVTVNDNRNNPKSIATETENWWRNADRYFRDLIAYVQGVRPKTSEGMQLFNTIRSGYAKYQLGANPKVWVTQLSSFVAACNIIDVSSLLESANVKADDVDVYCKLAKLRNEDNTAALAQGVFDRTTKAAAAERAVSKLGDVLMTPIGMMDRFVVKRLYAACQVQVAKDGGGAVGTVKNKKAAGELLERVILETQQNAMGTEKSWAMRSSNEILRGFTMFSADGMKLLARFIDAAGEAFVLHNRIAHSKGAERAKYEKRMKVVIGKIGRGIGTLVGSSVFMVLVGMLFKHVYARDDEITLENAANDLFGNLIGGLPVIRDVYSVIFDGYDLENFAYSVFNDIVNGFPKLVKSIVDWFNGGDPTAISRSFKSFVYSVGQLTGIPMRNIYNAIYGSIKRFFPQIAGNIDDFFGY